MGWFRSLRHEVPPPETRLDLGPAHCQAALLPKSPREPPPARLPFSLPALSLHLHPDGSVHQPSPPSPGAALCPIHWTKAAGAKPVRPVFPTESSLNPFSRVPRLFLTNVHVSSIECSLLSPTPTHLANCLSHACGCLPNLPLIHTSYESQLRPLGCLPGLCVPRSALPAVCWSQLVPALKAGGSKCFPAPTVRDFVLASQNWPQCESSHPRHWQVVQIGALKNPHTGW